MKVLISNSAFSDLENVKEYYEEQDVPEIGINFISEIFFHIETLNKHPRIGRSVPEFLMMTLLEKSSTHLFELLFAKRNGNSCS